MTISRRDLYAMGEPMGDSTTRRKLGGGYVCGFGGDSSSASSSDTYNTDRRVTTRDGLGITGDSNNVSVTNVSTDSGLVSRALDSVDRTNAINGQGFTSLLSSNDKTLSGIFSLVNNTFNRGEALIGQTQQAVADAYSQAQANKQGTIDNRTMIVLAMAAVAGLFVITRRK